MSDEYDDNDIDIYSTPANEKHVEDAHVEHKEKNSSIEFIEEKPLISQPLLPNSTKVTIKKHQLSQIKKLNEDLEKIIQDKTYKEINAVKERVKENKEYILKQKQKLPSQEQAQKFAENKQKLESQISKINESKMIIEKYDQTKAFLSILIEKSLNVFHPKLQTEENIHEKLINSVEEDPNFQYGKDLLKQISST